MSLLIVPIILSKGTAAAEEDYDFETTLVLVEFILEAMRLFIGTLPSKWPRLPDDSILFFFCKNFRKETDQLQATDNARNLVDTQGNWRLKEIFMSLLRRRSTWSFGIYATKSGHVICSPDKDMRQTLATTTWKMSSNHHTRRAKEWFYIQTMAGDMICTGYPRYWCRDCNHLEKNAALGRLSLKHSWTKEWQKMTH